MFKKVPPHPRHKKKKPAAASSRNNNVLVVMMMMMMHPLVDLKIGQSTPIPIYLIAGLLAI